MRSFRDMNPVVIGLVSVAVIAALVGAAFMVGILHIFESTYSVKAVFSDASGVRVGDDVRVAGVKVGRVTAIEADRERGNVVIHLAVESAVELGSKATAEVGLDTLLGTRSVHLGGPVVQPYLADVDEDRRIIPIDRTTTPFDVFELTKVGTRAVQATDTERLNRMITQLADVTEGNRHDITRLLTAVADVSAALNERDVQLRQLLDRADTLSGTLAEKDQTLIALLDQSKAILDVVERRRLDIRSTLRDSSVAVDELAGIIARNKAHIDEILTTLHPTIEMLDRRHADLERSLAWLGPGALGLASATSHGPWEDIYIQSLGPNVVTLLQSQLGGAP